MATVRSAATAAVKNVKSPGPLPELLVETAATTTTNNPTRGPLFARVQTGLGNLVAQATTTPAASKTDNTNTTTTTTTRTTRTTTTRTTTRLVNTSHQAPFRWIPLQSSTVAQAGAAIVYASNYGGGMLPGDAYRTVVQVQATARLGVLTQGANRVYKQTQQGNVVRSSRLDAHYRVQADGLLVVAPDPTTLFRNAALQQTLDIELHPAANLCFIDWVAAGRVTQGERWQQACLTSRTQLFIRQEDEDNNNNNNKNSTTRPTLVDAVHLTNAAAPGMDWSDRQFNAYANLILYGPQVEAVRQVCQTLSTVLAAPWTQTRSLGDDHHHQDDKSATPLPPLLQDESLTSLPASLAGPVLMGFTTIPTEHHNQDLTMVRLAATANEDVYRVLEACLAPLSSTFGHRFYKERIRATRSAPMPRVESNKDKNHVSTEDSDTQQQRQQQEQPKQLLPQTNLTPQALWAAHVLTDSSLPTGGFAHSAGLEAAAQLRLVQTPADITAFCHATVQSTLQLVTPALVQVHKAVHADQLTERWPVIHQELHALMVGNGAACRASLDQGTSLWRLARQWSCISSTSAADQPSGDIRSLEPGHYAAVFGLVTARWGLSVEETRYLLAYCIARDVVSAAVRLNLIGPLASVPLLAEAYKALDRLDTTTPAASCAPVLEALQPMHDLLAVRLFRT